MNKYNIFILVIVLLSGCSSEPKLIEVKKLSYTSHNSHFQYFVIEDYPSDSLLFKNLINNHLKVCPIDTNTIRTYLKEPDWHDNNILMGEQEGYLKQDPDIPNSNDYLCIVSRYRLSNGTDTIEIKIER